MSLFYAKIISQRIRKEVINYMNKNVKILVSIIVPVVILFIAINFMIISDFREKKTERQRVIEFKQAETYRIEQGKINEQERILVEERRVAREKIVEKQRLREQREAEEIAREHYRISNRDRQRKEEKERQRILSEEKKRDDSYLFYTLKGCRYKYLLKDSWRDQKAAEGIWVIVDFSVENRGRKERQIPSLHLIDEYGREHGSDFTGISDELDVFEDINPGIRIYRTVVFDVPKEANYKLKVKVFVIYFVLENLFVY